MYPTPSHRGAATETLPYPHCVPHGLPPLGLPLGRLLFRGVLGIAQGSARIEWSECSVGVTDGVSRPAHTAPTLCCLSVPRRWEPLCAAAASASGTAVAAVCCSEGVRASPGSALLGRGPRSGLSLPPPPPACVGSDQGAVLPRWGHGPLRDEKWALKLGDGGRKEPSAQLRKGEPRLPSVDTGREAQANLCGSTGPGDTAARPRGVGYGDPDLVGSPALA